MDNPKSWKFKIALLFCNHSTPIIRIGRTTYYLTGKRQRQLMRYSWMTTIPSLIFLIAMTRIMRDNDTVFESFFMDFLVTLIAYLGVFYLLGILVMHAFINDAYVHDLIEESDRLKQQAGVNDGTI